jgi:hypothetical protein
MSKRYTISEFIEKANKIHNNKYEYLNLKEPFFIHDKIAIKCPIHGIFYQTGVVHLNNHGCPKCAANVKLTTESYLAKLKNKYGEIFDYSKVKNYVDCNSPITLICKKHNYEYTKKAYIHLNKNACPLCRKETQGHRKDYTQKEFDQLKEKLNKIHNNKYDYSLIKLKGFQLSHPVKIICPIHGVFKQRIFEHIKGIGCAKCAGVGKFTQEEFIEKANKVHNNKYDYSKVNYVNSSTKVEIICPTHGSFFQTPANHLQGQNCPKCAKTSDAQTFIEKANKIHNNKYDYSKVNYLGSARKVEIICPKHGSFWQTPNSHLCNAGCPSCANSRGEDYLRKIFIENKINFEAQKTFEGCKDKKLLRFDFYLPDFNTCIEYQGIQHYEVCDKSFCKRRFSVSKKQLEYTKKHDQIKRDFCKCNNIKELEINDQDDVVQKLKENNILA